MTRRILDLIILILSGWKSTRNRWTD